MVVSGCIRKQPAALVSSDQSHEASFSENIISKTFSSDDIAIQEAKLADVFVPFAAQPFLEACAADEQSVQLSYSVAMPPDELAALYREHMEHLGWHTMSTIVQCDTLLVFIKPDACCAVQLCALAGERTQFTIFKGHALFAH